jgi:hypothetical protein
LTSSLKAYVVDTIKLHEIDDLVTGSGETEDHLTVTYRQTHTVTFVSKSKHQTPNAADLSRKKRDGAPDPNREIQASRYAFRRAGSSTTRRTRNITQYRPSQPVCLGRDPTYGRLQPFQRSRQVLRLRHVSRSSQSHWYAYHR